MPFTVCIPIILADSYHVGIILLAMRLTFDSGILLLDPNANINFQFRCVGLTHTCSQNCRDRKHVQSWTALNIDDFSIHLDKEEKIINSCEEETLSCTISKTVMHIQRAELAALTQGMCSVSIVANKTCATSYINSQFQVLAEVKTMCEGRNRCNISVNSLSSDPCPFERKYVDVLYRCVMRSGGYPGTFYYCVTVWFSLQSVYNCLSYTTRGHKFRK
jgi:hypothetical protein